MNILKRYNMPTVVLFCLLAAGTLLLFTPLRLVSFLILVISIAAVFPFSRSFGFILRAALTFLFITCLQQVIGLVFWKLNAGYTYTWAFLPLYTFTALFLAQTRFTYTLNFDFKRREIVSIAVGVLSAGLIALSTLQGGPHAQQLMRFVTRGFDSSTHLSLVVSLYDNQGYLYGPVSQVGHKLVFSALTAYPEGWHLATAIMWHGLSDNLSMEHTSKLLAVYFATVLLWYAIMLFLFTNFALQIAEKLSKKALSWLEYSSVIGIALLLQLATLLGVMRYGFVNYIAIIAYLLALSALLLELYLGLLRKRVFLVTGSLLAAGVALTWLLAAPIGYLMLLTPLLLSAHFSSLKGAVALVRKNVFIIAISGLILSSGFMLLLLQTMYNTVPDNINAGTVIWPTNHLVYSFLFAVFMAALLTGKVIKPVMRTLSVSIFSTGFVIGGVYLFQYHTAAKTGYYFEKINVLLLVFLAAFLGALFTTVTRQLSKLHGPIFAVIILVCLVTVAPVVFGINTSESRFALATDRKLSAYTASQIGDLIAKGQASHNNVVVMKDLDYEEDVITTHFINALSRYESPCSSGITWGLITGNEDQTVNKIIECAGQQKAQTYYVITSNKNYDRLAKSFTSTSNVKLILSN